MALRRGGINIEEKYPRSLVTSADSDRLTRALENLISNAIKYSPPNGTVRVEIQLAREAAGPRCIIQSPTPTGAALRCGRRRAAPPSSCRCRCSTKLLTTKPPVPAELRIAPRSRGSVRKARGGRADDAFDAKVKVLKEQIEHHVKEEEEELFPKVKKQFSKTQLQEMGQLMEQMVAHIAAGVAEPRQMIPSETGKPAAI